MAKLDSIAVKLAGAAPHTLRAALLALPVYEEQVAARGGPLRALDETLGGRLSLAIDAEGFEGKAGQQLLLPALGRAERVLLLGLGPSGGLRADAAFDHGFERDRAVTGHGQPPAVHLTEHAEDIEHRLVDAVARERAEAGEVRLIFKLEGPGQRALEIHAVFVGEVVFARETCGGIRGGAS